MNERIRKLALETDVWCDQNWAGHEFYNIRWEEKFAELIVRECVDIIQRESEKAIRDNTYMGDDVPASVTQWKIKEHFGVK